MLLYAVAFRNSVMHPVQSMAATENIRTAANLPASALSVANRLRATIESLSA